MKMLDIVHRVAPEGERNASAAVLMAREGTVRDIPHCYSLYTWARSRYVPVSWRALPELWSTLLSGGRMRLSLVENRVSLRRSRIVGFVATVFVTDEFCRETKSTLPPYLGLQLTLRYLANELPVLSQLQAKRANSAGGLNVLSCFESWETDGLSPNEIFAARHKRQEAFRLTHLGYCLKEFLAETIGRTEFDFMRAAGARLRRDYASYFTKCKSPTPAPAQRPRLVGLTTREALARSGSYLAGFFAYTAPRFHFNPSEQELLRQALLGQTSEELVTSLHISPSTVKKRWRSIYERATNTDEALLPPPVSNGTRTDLRGLERRRRLLQYLRQHAEELRSHLGNGSSKPPAFTMVR